VATETGDVEGDVIATQDASHLSENDVEQALAGFRGEIDQVPSMYSAIKHQGQPLYKLARKGLEVDRKSRRVVINRLDLVEFRPGSKAEVDVAIECTKGTYVRSLAEDLGVSLGCGGHVSALRRTQAGPFTIASCVTMATLEALQAEQDLAAMDSLLLPADAAIETMPLVELTESAGFYLRQGQPVLVSNAPRSGMVRVALEDGEFLGVGEILDDGRIAPRRLIVSN
jgi:tRNA pseudouridine55 synthase